MTMGVYSVKRQHGKRRLLKTGRACATIREVVSLLARPTTFGRSTCSGGAMERLASGFEFLEAPRLDGEGNLYFVDHQAVYRLDAGGSIETLLGDRPGVGGLLFHEDGGLVVSGPDVSHLRPDGKLRTLLALEDVFSFNDIHADDEGRVYAGTLRSGAPEEPDGTKPGECWRMEAGRDPVELYANVGFTNGIGFSPNGRFVYHADTMRREIIVHELAGDGSISFRRRLSTTAAPGLPDGLAVDETGRLWLGMYGGGCVACFTPDGVLKRTVQMPADNVTSLCFGGDDQRDVCVVTCDTPEEPALKGCIYRTRFDVPGLPTPLACV